jgi:hypothetical protein
MLHAICTEIYNGMLAIEKSAFILHFCIVFTGIFIRANDFQTWTNVA